MGHRPEDSSWILAIDVLACRQLRAFLSKNKAVVLLQTLQRLYRRAVTMMLISVDSPVQA